MSKSIVAIDPGGTHWAGTCLFLSVHEVVNHERTIRRSESRRVGTQSRLGESRRVGTQSRLGEQFAQPYGFCRRIAIVKRRWAFHKLVILNRRPLWQSPPQRGDS